MLFKCILRNKLIISFTSHFSSKSIDEHAEVLHTARCTLFGTRQILKGLHGLHRTKVDNDEMRGSSTFLRLPVGALLQVEDLVARVVSILIFAVGILRGPRLTRQSLTVLPLQVQLGDSNAVAVFLRREAFDGEVAALLWSIEADGLPAVAALEAARSGRSGAVQVGLVADVVVLVALLQLQLVQFRLCLSPYHSLFRADNIEDDNLVLAFL